RRAHNDQVEDGSGGVDDQLAAASRAYDATKVAGVDGGHRNHAALAQEAPRALRIAVAAPHRMSFPLEQLCEKRAGGAGAQDEDPHGVGRLYHTSIAHPDRGPGMIA